MSDKHSQFREYLDLLLQLDQLEKEGRRDSKEDDDVRDQMDPRWYSMTMEEQDLMGRVSEALRSKNRKIKELEDRVRRLDEDPT